METFKVEVKSKEMIKPCSETADELKILQLSFIDQYVPPIHMPYIFFYQTQTTITTSLLKNSLSQTLPQFYPLAGRSVEGKLWINCNDQGVEFYEADVLASLAEVIANPDAEELIKLLPYPPLSSSTNSLTLTAVQVNRFSCGGMAISVCISHKIADAATAFAFINAWACNARAGAAAAAAHNMKPVTSFDSASFVSQMDLTGMYDPEIVISKGKIVTRRLVFNKEKLDELKKKCENGEEEVGATRVGVVSAFLWDKFLKLARAKPSPPKHFQVSQVINLRTIKGSPITENHQGNLFWTTITLTPMEQEMGYREAVGILRSEVKKIDVSYLARIKTGECLMDLQNVYEQSAPEGGNFCGISSFVRMRAYEVDFGWGKPIWVSQTTLPFQNTTFLLPTRCGQGIEAWMNVLEPDADRLQQDHEFRSLLAPPLHIIAHQ